MKNIKLNEQQEKLFAAVIPHIKEDKMEEFEKLIGDAGREIEAETGRDISEEPPEIMDKVFNIIMPKVMTYIKPVGLMRVNSLFKNFIKTGEVE